MDLHNEMGSIREQINELKIQIFHIFLLLIDLNVTLQSDKSHEVLLEDSVWRGKTMHVKQ